MNLRDILGDLYRDDMTLEEINTAISGMKLADLSTGAYVDKNKYDADLKAKDAEIQKKATALHEKMTADEQKAAADAEKDALIEQLQTTIRNQTISSNRSKAESLTSEIRTILELKDDDNEYSSFLENITYEDDNKTSALSKYITKLVKDSYEKGKKDATRNSFGDFGKDVGTGGTPKEPEVGSLGKRLAQSSIPTIDPNTYFKRN